MDMLVLKRSSVRNDESVSKNTLRGGPQHELDNTTLTTWDIQYAPKITADLPIQTSKVLFNRSGLFDAY